MSGLTLGGSPPPSAPREEGSIVVKLRLKRGGRRGERGGGFVEWVLGGIEGWLRGGDT